MAGCSVWIRLPRFAGLAVAFCMMLGCEQAPTTSAAGRQLTVVTTTGMVADVVRHVGGDRVAVTALMGPGVDPHGYNAGPGDALALEQADAIFFSGLHLEGKMASTLQTLAERKPAVAVAERLPQDRLLTEPGSDVPDPHVWFDVSLWADVAAIVRDALVELDPQHRSTYEKNAEAYIQRLGALHDEVAKQLAEIPKERRVLITAHDAFGYFGRAYDVEVRGIQGISTESDPSLSHVQELVDFIVERGVKAVFVESSVPEKLVRSLIERTAARGHEVSIGGELFSDAMGDANTPEGTYEGMVRHNVNTIVSALR